jgi:hypothetical protein
MEQSVRSDCGDLLAALCKSVNSFVATNEISNEQPNSLVATSEMANEQRNSFVTNELTNLLDASSKFLNIKRQQIWTSASSASSPPSKTWRSYSNPVNRSTFNVQR